MFKRADVCDDPRGTAFKMLRYSKGYMASVVIIITVTPMSSSSQTLILAKQQGQRECLLYIQFRFDNNSV